ncbi:MULTISPECIES: 3-phosphoshikimate 1-carboxyvinyltransferase [Thermococcus]|uniref:3-phosphoshikimate 1-carboxyvinyltransferase n=1 Tax=Thermococcus sibiricus TaxID=172049 RepID=A0A101EM71_9EURY|nr:MULTISPECIES: 3-phosphoshikimate 1-carboxyvinyltransferase [Thermococcus]KUK17943.1 MAG: 5-enolpyruvylshikimate-3-phosphate synthase [Thermococcus sibiricus]KUK29316.1 MAG: 5-enolpyruvylshikimate-3-phosphate synthase [Thermococcus sp. 40_45]MBC7094620.1 3-phosphoshikimate 1-carboxyvinyltransferase [Thermococcus sp.]HII67902.1 3-phosphoshikimate 1-carboxyvinyltransferase [Thermococcaceae archaeon]
MIEITPIETLNGKIKAPPSKSYTHRALFLGLLSEGKSKIENPLICTDTFATLNAVRAFGAKADWNFVESSEEVKPAKINAFESGTTARLAIGISALANGESMVDGKESLRKRPMEPLLKALNELGVKTQSNGFLPVRIFGGGIKKDHVRIDGSISSQFITALLLLGAKVGLTVEVLNPISKPYIEITLRTLKWANVKFERDENIFHVYQGMKAGHFLIPGDYSSASFFLVAGAIFGKVRVEGLDKNDVQADKAIVELLKEFGAELRAGKDYLEVERDELIGQEVDCRDFPDLFPILAVLGAYSKGRTVLRARHLHYKESDRIRAMALNLAKMGAKVKEFSDGLIISKSKLNGAVLDPQNDHRIAMALAIAALGARGKSLILNERCIEKSYPNFFEDLRRLILQ